MDDLGGKGKFNWKQFFVVGIIALIAGAVLWGVFFQKDIEKECPIVNQTECEICPDVNQTVADCPICEECFTEEEQKKQQQMISGYLVEGITLQEEFNWDKYRRLNLFDGDVKFDGDDYDAKEIFGLTGLELLANGDFEGVPYLTVPGGTVFYRFEIPYLDKSTIGDDGETLTFNLLGNEVEVSKWKTNEITFTQGESSTLSEGSSITIEGKVVTLTYALDKSALIDVDGIGREVDEGQVKIINGLQIKVEYSFETTSFRTGEARLIIGEEVEKVVGDGDPYVKDSIWEWEVTDKYIGLILEEGFTDDEDALELGESVCLPNDYLCVVYNGVLDESTEEYTFETIGSYIRAEGNFISSEDVDYDKVYIDATGIYSDDEMDGAVFNISNRINETTIKLGDTESNLDIDGLWIVIEDFKVNLDLSDVWGDGETIKDEEHNYLTNYGILIEDPKDSIVDEEFIVVVPEEKLEGSLLIKQGKPEEPVCDVDNLELCIDETTCTDATGYWYGEVCNLEEPSE